MRSKANSCRCGHADDSTPHPCHGKGYTCRQSAKERFYNPRPVALAGVMPKMEMSQSWACDACWEEFKVLLDKARSDGESRRGNGLG